MAITKVIDVLGLLVSVVLCQVPATLVAQGK
jgi:hypothetical protein